MDNMITLCLLLSLAPAVSAFWGYRWGQWHNGFSAYTSGHCTCTSPRISLDHKMALISLDNDVNKDGVITVSDITTDVSERYDVNSDQQLSHSECVEHWRCRYGDTEQVAQYMCTDIMRGEPSVPIAAFNSEPFISGVPLAAFLQNGRARYDTFFANKCTNRFLTREDKLTLNAANNDYNNDGIVTSEDLEYDLSKFYDTDNDGVVTKAEFVLRWICNYADSADYARFLFDNFRQGSSTIGVTAFRGPPFDTGVPLDEFKATNRQNYENYAARDVDSYIQYLP